MPEKLIKAILFDVGWTLMYPNPTRKQVNERFLLNLGYSFLPDELESANDAAANYYRTHRWLPEAMRNNGSFWQAYYAIFTERLGIYESGLPRAFHENAINSIQYHLYPETLDVLQELHRRGFLVGAVSNWNTNLPEIIKKVGLKDYLDILIVSDLVGYHKPQPEIFRFALEALKVQASETMHVGDNLAADVEGARQAGIKPVWLERRPRHDAYPLDHIQTLDEILVIITTSYI